MACPSARHLKILFQSEIDERQRPNYARKQLWITLGKLYNYCLVMSLTWWCIVEAGGGRGEERKERNHSPQSASELIRSLDTTMPRLPFSQTTGLPAYREHQNHNGFGEINVIDFPPPFSPTPPRPPSCLGTKSHLHLYRNAIVLWSDVDHRANAEIKRGEGVGGTNTVCDVWRKKYSCYCDT